MQLIPQQPRSRIAISSVAAFLALGVAAVAGSLTPSALPASTMHSLEELYDSIAGVFDSSAIVSSSSGSLIEHLKYIEENMVTAGVASDALDFDEFVDAMTLDADTDIASGGNTLSILSDVRIGDAVASSAFGHLVVGSEEGTNDRQIAIGGYTAGGIDFFRQRGSYPCCGIFLADIYSYANTTAQGFNTEHPAANIGVFMDASWSGLGTAPAAIRFQTAPASSSALLERMRITSGGNVGIGVGINSVGGSNAVDALLEVRATASYTTSNVASISGASLTSGNALFIRVPDSGFTGSALRVSNTGSNNLFSVWGDGSVSISGNFELSGYVSSNLTPTVTNTYSLGTSALRWSNLFATNASISNNLEVSNIASVSQLYIGGNLFSPAAPSSLSATVEISGDGTADMLKLTESDQGNKSYGFVVRDGDLFVRAPSSSGAFSANWNVLSVASDSLAVTVGTPASPSLIGSRPNGVGFNVYDAVVAGKYAYTAQTSGLVIIDISRPASPSVVGNAGGSFGLGVAVAGRYAYLAQDASGLTVIDITNASSPTVVGQYNSPGSATAVYVSGRYAYLVDSSTLYIVDVSNATTPTVAGSTGLSGSGIDVYVVNGYAYVTVGSSGLDIIDVSDPTAPAVVGSYDTTGFAENVIVSGRFAYVGDFGGGLVILDVSDPTTPLPVGSYNTDGLATGVAVAGDYAYVADQSGGMKVINIRNPAAPTLVSSVDATGSEDDVFVSGRYAYVSTTSPGAGGFHIIDIGGVQAHALFAGNISSNDITAYENVSVGNSLYVRNGLNVGSGGIQAQGFSAFSSASWFGSSVSISGNFELTGSVSSHLIPRLNDTYDLGSPNFRWRDVYVSSGSLHIGNAFNEAVIDYDDAFEVTMTGAPAGGQDIVLSLNRVDESPATPFLSFTSADDPGTNIEFTQVTTPDDVQFRIEAEDPTRGLARFSLEPGDAFTGLRTQSADGLDFVQLSLRTDSPNSSWTVNNNGAVGTISLDDLGTTISINDGVTTVGTDFRHDGVFFETNASVSGNLEVGSDVFFVNAATGNVGIASSSPGAPLAVEGDTRIDGQTAFGNAAAINGGRLVVDQFGDFLQVLQDNEYEVTDLTTYDDNFGEVVHFRMNPDDAINTGFYGRFEVIDIDSANAQDFSGANLTLRRATIDLSTYPGAAVGDLTGDSITITSPNAATNVVRGAEWIVNGTDGSTITGASAEVSSYGTTDRLIGVQARTLPAVGTVSESYAFYADINSNATSAQNRSVGFYTFGNDSVAPSSLSYALYTDGLEWSYFGGNVGIGTPNPTARLVLQSGTASISNTLWVSPALYAGNVGIGMDVPESKLEIEGTFPQLGLGDGVMTPARLGGTDCAGGEACLALTSGVATTPLQISLGAADGALTLRSSGFVGVGTTEPGAKLDVFGTTNTMRISYDIDNYAELYTDSGGTLFIDTVNTTGPTQPWNIVLATTGGNVGIGDANPTNKLEVRGTASVSGDFTVSETVRISSVSDGNILRLQDSDGTCDLNPEAGGVTESCSSDERLKKDIEDAPSMLAYLDDFRIREYTMRSSGDRLIGVIAQEVAETHPELVSMGPNGLLMVQTPGTWQLIKAIQELSGRIDSLAVEGPADSPESDSWFSSLFSRILTAFQDLLGIGFGEGEVRTERLCAGDVCVNETQLRDLLEMVGGDVTDEPEPSDEPAETEEPTPTDEPASDEEGSDATQEDADESAEEEGVTDEPADDSGEASEQSSPDSGGTSEAPEGTESSDSVSE